MTKKVLRVGLIGTGEIARIMHLPAWQELANEGRIELTAVCDIIEERAQKSAEQFGAKKVYVQYEKMLKAERFDIIDICTPNGWHSPMAVNALEAGCHVIVEKPMATSVAEARLMLETSQKVGLKLMVAQQERFQAANEILKQEIEAGRLGKIYMANTRYLRRRGIPGWGKFHIKAESFGGPMIDLGVHIIDLCVWLMGNPKPVAASGKVYRMFGDRPDLCNGEWGRPYPSPEFDVEDYAVGLVRFENDITMIVETSWAANIAQDCHGVTILGDKGGISTNPPAIMGARENALTSLHFDWLPKIQAHRAEIRHFAECVEKNLPVRVQPAESVEIQKIINAIYDSSQANREVVIS